MTGILNRTTTREQVEDQGAADLRLYRVDGTDMDVEFYVRARSLGVVRGIVTQRAKINGHPRTARAITEVK